MGRLNQRKMKRRHLIYYLRVFDAVTGRLVGHLVDITVEGIMLISEEPIEANQDFKFKMVLPDEVLQTDHIVFDARSIWCKKDINPDFYATGLKVITIDPDTLLVIDSLIHKYGFND